MLEIVNSTGALDTGVSVLVKKLHGKEEILIAVLMFLFSVGGTTYGMCEETVPFYLLLATTMVAAGMDDFMMEKDITITVNENTKETVKGMFKTFKEGIFDVAPEVANHEWFYERGFTVG